MTKWNYVSVSALALAICAGDSRADAQSIGTFKWQLQPYCNVVTLAVTQVDGAYRLEGTDDQCGGAADRASAMGTAFPNPDGTIGFGLTIVATPGGVPVHVDAALAAGQFNGTWRDSAGGRGDFVLTPGAGSGGTVRPLPSGPVAEVPPAIHLRTDGGFSAGGVIDVGAAPAAGPGVRMMWHPAKAAFRAGQADAAEWDGAAVGRFSVAMGRATVASADGATALGLSTNASAAGATALGVRTSASGEGSLAQGVEAEAPGFASAALGYRARANSAYSFAAGYDAQTFDGGSIALGSGTRASTSGAVSIGTNASASASSAMALGLNATASGFHATAIGMRVTAVGLGSVVVGMNAETTAAGRGSFVFGDSSVPTVPGLQSYSPNEFVSRFAGGYYFFSNAALSAGVRLNPGANSWSSLSDVHSKENFRDLAADDILAKIAAMPVREWNYKSQDAAIRHMGPTAQDFHAAFGLGEDPLRISTIDADGVALAAVKALEARTRTDAAAARDELEALRAEVAALRSLVAELVAPQ